MLRCLPVPLHHLRVSFANSDYRFPNMTANNYTIRGTFSFNTVAQSQDEALDNFFEAFRGLDHWLGDPEIVDEYPVVQEED